MRISFRCAEVRCNHGFLLRRRRHRSSSHHQVADNTRRTACSCFGVAHCVAVIIPANRVIHTNVSLGKFTASDKSADVPQQTLKFGAGLVRETHSGSSNDLLLLGIDDRACIVAPINDLVPIAIAISALQTDSHSQSCFARACAKEWTSARTLTPAPRDSRCLE